MSQSTTEIFRRRQVAASDPELRERDERLESLKLIIWRMAHDFNNFLAPILGYLTLIREEVAEDSTVAKYATTLEQSARRSESAIESIMLAAQPQRNFQPRLTDLGAIIVQELAVWKAALPATVQIHVEQDLAPCITILDEGHWRRVVQELLRNARFALATGGQLAITLRKVHFTEARAQALGIKASQGWELVFQDNGLGMAPEILRRSCEPFFSTRPRNQSPGLGLTIVHSVVRWHGGQVHLGSQEEGGTSVTLWLPDLPVDTTAPAPSPAPVEVQPKVTASPVAGKKILLVDDDPMVLEVIKTCLQRAGFEVQTATDGAQALRTYQRGPANWSLVISDVTMPNMGGVELAQRMRALNPEVRVVLVSGDTEATREEALSALQPNVPPLIKKPFTLKGFLDVIKQQFV